MSSVWGECVMRMWWEGVSEEGRVCSGRVCGGECVSRESRECV